MPGLLFFRLTRPRGQEYGPTGPLLLPYSRVRMGSLSACQCQDAPALPGLFFAEGGSSQTTLSFFFSLIMVLASQAARAAFLMPAMPASKMSHAAKR